MKKTRISKTCCLLMLMVIAALFLPVTARAELSKKSEGYVAPSWNSPIQAIAYSETSDGKVSVTISTNVVTYKNKYAVIYCSIENGKVQKETVLASALEKDSKYTLNRKFDSGNEVGIYIYNLANEDDDVDLTDREIISAAEKFTMPLVTANPLDDIITVNLADGAKSYTGTFNGARQVNVYKLNAVSDAYLTITDFKSNDSDGCLGLFYFEEKMKKLYAADGESRIYANQNGTITAGLSSKRNGDYYLVMDGGGKGAAWSFKMEFRKYRHAYVEVKAKEGDLSGAFPQNTDLHFTATLSPANTDARFTSESSVTSPGKDNTKVTVARDGKTCTFTVRTENSAVELPYTLHFTELDPENISSYYGTTGMSFSKDFSITTGLSSLQLSPEVGYNFIKFKSFNIPEYSAGETANITVYLKQGKTWRKKFSVPAFSKTTKTIKKLKPGKKYTFKTVITKKINTGKTVKTSSKYTVKTGPGSAPNIKSLKVSNVKQTTVWRSGWWDSGWNWHPGHWDKYTAYKLTITLKKAVKGAVGLEVNGMRATGKGKTYTLNSSKLGHVQGSKAQFTIRAITNNTYGGFSKPTKKYSVTLK